MKEDNFEARIHDINPKNYNKIKTSTERVGWRGVSEIKHENLVAEIGKLYNQVTKLQAENKKMKEVLERIAENFNCNDDVSYCFMAEACLKELEGE